MARSAQTELAVLGALSVEPMSGYDLRAAITDVLGHFWHESFGQIYPCLADLERRGLVRAAPRGRATVYRLTAAGRRRLTDLLRTEPEAQRPRNATLLRVFFGSAMTPHDLAAVLDRTESEAHARLAALAAVRLEVQADPLSTEHGPYWLATISAGEHAARASLAWVHETRATLLPGTVA